MDCPHRHFVFSIAKEMRKYFWMYRGLFDILFQTVNEALHLSIQKTKDDIKLYGRLGIISFLHSYGKDMKTNPHIHALVAERLNDKDQNLSVMSFFPFERLRKCWQYLLLKHVSDYLKVMLPKMIIINLIDSELFSSKSINRVFTPMILKSINNLQSKE